MTEDIESEYQELEKKQSLPPFEGLDEEFEISAIEDHGFLLRSVRRRMTERIDMFNNFIEELIQPDTTLANLHEVKDMDETKKLEVYELYRQMMAINRRSVLVGLGNSDTANAAFIKDVSVEWDKLKPRVEKVLRMMHDSWNESKITAENLEYFG
ncbi:MAG: hypothetical protein ABIC95_06645 [archaeon]